MQTMVRKHGLALVALALGGMLLLAAPAGAATTAQLGTKCRGQWAGNRTTKSFRTYRSRCIKASKAAISAATDAGNPASKVANRQRAITACTTQWPTRTTRTHRKSYNACVRAVRSAQLTYAKRPLRAVLKGSSEVPKSASTASGKVSVRLNEAARRVCFDLSVSNLGFGTVTTAKILRGRKGRKGKAVVTLGNAVSLDALNHHDRASNCVTRISKKTIRAILKSPTLYYVSVRTTLFPKGAARGQLKRTA
jgi:hypothetical protein